MFWESQRTQRTQRRRRWGGPCVRVKRTSGPGACRGMAGFARHALVFGKSSGDSRRPICPIGPIGPTAACSGDAGDSGDAGTTACLSRACRAFCSRGRFGASRLHAPWPWKVWRFAPARSVAVEGLALRACTLCSPGRRSRPSNQRISQSANQPGAPMERPCLRGEGSHRSAYGRTQPQVHAISHAVLQGVVLFYGRKHECELLIFVSPIPPYRGPEAIRPGPFSGSGQIEK